MVSIRYKILQINAYHASCVLFFLLLLCFLAGISTANARTIAIFPVEDLSKGLNSPNFKLTNYLADELSFKGMDIVIDTNSVNFNSGGVIRSVFIPTSR